MLTYSQYDKRLILLVFIVLGLGQAHRSPTCYPLDHLSSIAYCVYAFCWKNIENLCIFLNMHPSNYIMASSIKFYIHRKLIASIYIISVRYFRDNEKEELCFRQFLLIPVTTLKAKAQTSGLTPLGLAHTKSITFHLSQCKSRY